MNFSFILISDYLNKSVYILANKSYKCLKQNVLCIKQL